MYRKETEEVATSFAFYFCVFLKRKFFSFFFEIFTRKCLGFIQKTLNGRSKKKYLEKTLKGRGGGIDCIIGSHTYSYCERKRERERDDRGRVLRLPLVAPPSLFQPRDGVGFDRYDFDDVNDDDDRNNTCFLCTPMCFVVLLYL